MRRIFYAWFFTVYSIYIFTHILIDPSKSAKKQKVAVQTSSHQEAVAYPPAVGTYPHAPLTYPVAQHAPYTYPPPQQSEYAHTSAQPNPYTYPPAQPTPYTYPPAQHNPYTYPPAQHNPYTYPPAQHSAHAYAHTPTHDKPASPYPMPPAPTSAGHPQYTDTHARGVSPEPYYDPHAYSQHIDQHRMPPTTHMASTYDNTNRKRTYSDYESDAVPKSNCHLVSRTYATATSIDVCCIVYI